MQQEARNTETHTNAKWWNNSNLRHKAVQFVSAGQLNQAEPQDADREETNSQPGTHHHGEPETNTNVPLELGTDTENNPFFIDSTGDGAVATGLPNPVLSCELLNTDGDDNDESEDEVVFTGRQNMRMPIQIKTDEEQLQESLKIQPVQPPQAMAPLVHLEDTTKVQTKAIPHHRKRQGRSSEDEIDLLADYIANIDRDYEAQEQDIQVESHPLGNNGMDGQSTLIGRRNDVTQIIIDPKHSLEDMPNGGQVQDCIDRPSKSTPEAHTDPSSVIEDDYLQTSEDSDDEEDIDLLEELAISHIMPSGRKSGAFPSATAFADALESDPYYGFDIMDFNRPSLQKKPKGKKAPIIENYVPSDSELEAQLQWAWQTDRQKKKLRKKEREELRSQGLLGRDANDADLKVKYAKGMDVEELMSEIRTFLLSSKTSLSLPPMSKHRRKTIHELANKVNLKSQSRGNGMDRFPVLLKTSRTPQYTRKTICQIDNLFGGRKLNRRLFQSWSSSSTSKPPKPKRAGGGVTAGVTYTDGEVVGASAPEIGAGNRGRAMLEKMGWSSGTALGASNNKGILLPVTHVVKNSRAGLG
ncbi:hypothetical protein N7468_008984 [Penicillium chermesinum]|uniref:Protein SQS1 n=1 Tax=Penicillium chermesinum TaxID=63820 RepID=A0A9W9NGV8_9EURO|nr:uncharacterized protein N7468_008984 [Penicillium chermesinum]KAJ5219780.1 hypothetical protein N7468_008984 [Penicillium chermesinum]